MQQTTFITIIRLERVDLEVFILVEQLKALRFVFEVIVIQYNPSFRSQFELCLCLKLALDIFEHA